MTAIAIPTTATDAEAIDQPDLKGFEFVHGRLVEKLMSRESARVTATLTYLLHRAADASGGVEIYSPEMGYKCFAEEPKGHRKPDVSVIRLERLAGIATNVGFMPIPADLVVEVLSPHDLAYEVSEKVKEYLGNGFGLVWVVDPNARMVAIYTPDAEGRVLRETDEIDLGDLLPTFRHRVGEFFAAAGSAAK